MLTDPSRLYPKDGICHYEDAEERLNLFRSRTTERCALVNILSSITLIEMMNLIAQLGIETFPGKEERISQLAELTELEFCRHRLSWQHRPRHGRPCVDDLASQARVGDTVQLATRTTDGEGSSTLAVYGEWWHVTSATGKGEAWYLTSIKDQPKKAKTAVISNLSLRKAGDHLFKVVRIVAFPTTFSYKLHGKE